MSLASLVIEYVTGGAYNTAVANGDQVAQTRMRLELAQAVADEIPATLVDRSLTTAERNNIIRAYSVVLPNGPSIGTVTAIAATHPVTSKIKLGVQRMINHGRTVLDVSLAQLRGEFPTAAGVTNQADAIFPGTQVYAVWDNTPWEVSVAIVTEDNGDDPIEVTIAGVPNTIARSHIHFEYLDAVNDAAMTNVTLYDYYTNGVDSWPVVTINAMPIGTIILDNGVVGGLEVTVSELIAGTWAPDPVAQAIIDGLAIGQNYTDGVDTWPVLSINAFPTATVVLDNGVPGGLTVAFQLFVNGTWTLVP